MNIPVEIQREILSYIGYTFPKTNKGRCLCFTKLDRRCKRQLNYSKRIFCNMHYSDNCIKSIILCSKIKCNY